MVIVLFNTIPDLTESASAQGKAWAERFNLSSYSSFEIHFSVSLASSISVGAQRPTKIPNDSSSLMK